MTTPYPPFAGVPNSSVPKKKSRLGLILGIVGGVLVLCCAGGFVAALSVQSDKTPHAPATAAGAGATTAPAAGAAAKYKQPGDPCALGDLKLLGPRTGDGKGEPTEEKGDLPLPGCDYYLAAADGAQEVKAFAVADDKTAARFKQASDLYPGIAGFSGDKVSGCGAQAFFAKRLSYGDKRIEALLVCSEANLYVEVRFNAGGNEPWNADTMRTNMVAFAGAMIGAVPKN
ncbi:hypothetical protein [Dactylosporangium sp. CA-139066]|uniref:hypothetical protein n=1 Tax=Dactylosporangium sp. CA-139066 TaxID=3239930 RepID=UPI003D9363AB